MSVQLILLSSKSTTVSKVKTQYIKKTSCPVDLKYGGKFPAEEVQVLQLNHLDDQLVAFEAIEEGLFPVINDAPRGARTPLQDVNSRVTFKPSSPLIEWSKKAPSESPRFASAWNVHSESGSPSDSFGHSQPVKPEPHIASQNPNSNKNLLSSPHDAALKLLDTIGDSNGRLRDLGSRSSPYVSPFTAKTKLPVSASPHSNSLTGSDRGQQFAEGLGFPPLLGSNESSRANDGLFYHPTLINLDSDLNSLPRQRADNLPVLSTEHHPLTKMEWIFRHWSLQVDYL
jgi:hypothetical protein